MPAPSVLRAFASHLVKSIPDAAVGGAAVVVIDVVTGRAESVVGEAVTFVFVVALCAVGFALYRVLWDESEGRFD